MLGLFKYYISEIGFITNEEKDVYLFIHLYSSYRHFEIEKIYINLFNKKRDLFYFVELFNEKYLKINYFNFFDDNKLNVLHDFSLS